MSKTIVEVDYRKDNISNSSYFLLIDLDNAEGAGPYKHAYVSGDGIKLVGVTGSLRKITPGDKWISFFCVVLNVTESNTTLVPMRPGTIGLRSTADVQKELEASPLTTTVGVPMNLRVVDGTLTNIAVGGDGLMVVTDLTSASQIPDVAGTNRAVAPGDVVLRLQRISGNQSVFFQYHCWYYVEQP